MVWLYLLLDVLLIAALGGIIIFLVYIVRKRETHTPVDLSQFRNEEIYEKSKRDKLEKAHIDEIEHQEVNEKASIEDISYDSEYRKRDLDALLEEKDGEDEDGD